MIGTKEWLFDFDDSFRESIQFRDDSKIPIMGRGNMKLCIGGKTQIYSKVYCPIGLRNNLLSLSQLLQNKLSIVFHDDICKVFHEERSLIINEISTSY